MSKIFSRQALPSWIWMTTTATILNSLSSNSQSECELSEKSNSYNYWSCSWKCNREVTWIFGKRPCLYKSDGGRSIVTSLACACCEVLCGVTAFIWNKYPGFVSDIPEFCLDYKLPATKNIELATGYLGEKSTLFCCFFIVRGAIKGNHCLLTMPEFFAQTRILD